MDWDCVASVVVLLYYPHALLDSSRWINFFSTFTCSTVFGFSCLVCSFSVCIIANVDENFCLYSREKNLNFSYQIIYCNLFHLEIAKFPNKLSIISFALLTVVMFS